MTVTGFFGPFAAGVIGGLVMVALDAPDWATAQTAMLVTAIFFWGMGSEDA